MNTSIGLIENVLEKVDLLASIQEMLEILAPCSKWTADPRRYEVLKYLLDGKSVPFTYIARDKEGRKQIRRELIARALSLQVEQRQDTVRTLAILFWEWACTGEADKQCLTEEIHEAYLCANILWQCLLADSSFWHRFASVYEVTNENMDQVRKQVVEQILSKHVSQARAYVTNNNNLEDARFHIRCLSEWNCPPCLEHLGARKNGETSKSFFDPSLGLLIKNCANSLINSWVSELLQQAEDMLNDGAVLQRLPEGIRHNFEGVIQFLEPVLEVLTISSKLLAYVVKQHNEYAYELAIAERRNEAREVIQKSCKWAQLLAEKHLKPGDKANPDNQMVVDTYILASKLEPDGRKSMRYIEMGQQWVGNTEELNMNFDCARIRCLIDAKDYQQTSVCINELEQTYGCRSEIHELRIVLRFRKGMDALNQARGLCEKIRSSAKAFLEAWRGEGPNNFNAVEDLYRSSVAELRSAEKMTKNASERKSIRSHADVAEDELSYAKHGILFQIVQEVIENEQEEFYSMMLGPLHDIPPDSPSSKMAKHYIALLNKLLGE
jgi:hypothetical protein